MVDGVQMQQRRGTAAQWSTSGKILAAGEIGVATDTKIIKVGDGVNEWDDLPVAFEDFYLTIGGTATNSALLGGISSSGFVKVVDATTEATGDKVARRFGDGRLKAAAGISTDDVANVAQMVAADAAAIVDARKETVSRDEGGHFTLALTDIGKLVRVNSASYSTPYNCTIPLNSSVPFPVGSWVDICAPNKGAAIIVPAGGVTYFGPTVVYGGGSLFRLLKTDTNAWHCVHVFYSPPPILRRKIKTGSDNNMSNATWTKLRLDGADSGTALYTNNADTLGANEQWSSSDNYKCYARRSGWYEVKCDLTVSGTASGRTILHFKVNNIDQDAGGGTVRGGLDVITATKTARFPLNLGDYVEVWAYQESGSTQSPFSIPYGPSHFEWAWERPL